MRLAAREETWAIDLYVGGEPREHEYLELAIASSSFPAVRAALPELEWFGVGDGNVTPIDDASDDLHQTWGLDRASGCWRLDVFREPWEGDVWVSRRDPALRRPVVEAIEHTRGGIPYLAPELVLLFKAKHSARERDRFDLARTLPLLEPARRRWLGEALRLVHPGHDWIPLVEEK
ncbi:MAG: hypothetical protein H0V94_02360 [Actinobacteria bacterium]|nr:hypothetical protein [Actinomycetota bacterium]